MEIRVLLIWFDHQSVQTSWTFCWETGRDRKHMTVLTLKEKESKKLYPWSPQETNKGHSKGQGLGNLLAAMKQHMEKIPDFSPWLFYGHCWSSASWWDTQGVSSLTCCGIFGNAIHRSTGLPPVLWGLSSICGVSVSRPWQRVGSCNKCTLTPLAGEHVCHRNAPQKHFNTLEKK